LLGITPLGWDRERASSPSDPGKQVDSVRTVAVDRACERRPNLLYGLKWARG